VGNSHYKSNLRAKTGSEVITGFNRIATIAKLHATDVIANSVASAPTVHGTTKVIAGNHIRISTNKYILTSAFTTAASVAAEATAYAKSSLNATGIAGSIVLGDGAAWYFSNGSTATKVGTV